MIRLLIFSHWFAPSIGGVETVVRELAQGLAVDSEGGRAFAVTVVTQTAAAGAVDSGLPYAVVRRPSWWRLWRLVAESDVIHVAGAALAPMIFGLLARRPVVVEHHGFQVICPTGQLFQEPQSVPCPGRFMAGEHGACLRCQARRARVKSLRLWLLTFVRRFVCKWATVNLTPTDWLAGQLGLPRSRTCVHGIRCGETPAHPPRERGGHVARFLFVGRLVASKGLGVLIEAARLLRMEGRAFEVVIVGEGPVRSAIEAQVSEGGLTSVVRLTGALTEGGLNEAWRRADALVAPSLAGEVFGMTLLDAMGRGLPVIASDLGSFAEVLGGSGLLFKTGDAAGLARCMAEVMDHPVRVQDHAAAGRARAAKSFRVEQMTAGHAALYRTLAPESEAR